MATNVALTNTKFRSLRSMEHTKTDKRKLERLQVNTVDEMSKRQKKTTLPTAGAA